MPSGGAFRSMPLQFAEAVGTDQIHSLARVPPNPSLALILYPHDAEPLFEGRPALELVDRLLPEPT